MVPGLRMGGSIAAILTAAILSACGGSSSPDPTSANVELSEAARNGTGFGAQLPRAPIEPLGAVGVPDINALGLLDGSGPNSASWPKVTNVGQKETLQVLGKALFWDMQVGGDGIQACASCHFNAGADNRVVNQINPGLNNQPDLAALNATLSPAHFLGTANGRPDQGLAVSETALLAAGFTPDAADGSPGALGTTAAGDIDDVISSHGVRAGQHRGVSAQRVDWAILDANDARAFNATFSAPAAGIPNTVRRVPGRNSPSVLNAVYNLRNFWDGRANMFFNGVNPLGVNDPDARVRVFQNGALSDQRLDLPFSSLASQAVGPIGSDFEMTNAGRPNADLGKKLTLAGVVPLAGQSVDPADSVLAGVRNASGRGLNTSYSALIRQVFDQRYWGDGNGNEVCVNATGLREAAVSGVCPTYTLMQYNFPLFFGLAVQAYEATLTTSQTIVDLIAGGVATGTIASGRARIDVNGMALDGCVAAAQQNNSANGIDAATRLCAAHYAKFIHPGAVSGAESGTAPNPVAPGSPIGGCANPSACSASPNAEAAIRTLLNVNRGLGRFFSGSTNCSVCHFNPEFTGATVSTVTRFGARLPALPNGQLRKELEARAVMERMEIFSGAVAVYDVGFYNLGVRPTAADRSIGDAIGGVPISISSILNIANGGSAGLNDVGKTQASADLLLNRVRIPTSPQDLSPQAFPATVGCALALTGGLNQCLTTVRANERLQVNGSFKSPGLRNVKFTGPFMHNGSKMNLRQVLEFYKTAGHFTQINFNNLDAGMREFELGTQEESALIEMMETGLTDWRVAYKGAPFDHPELCLPNGHDPATGKTRVAALAAVGKAGSAKPIATFEEILRGNPAILAARSNSMLDVCTVPGVASAGLSSIDAPPTRP